MSHKQAKRLRKIIGYNKTQSPAKYQDRVVKTVMVDSGNKNIDGSPLLKPESRVMRTLVGNSERSEYQLIKRKGIAL